MPAKAKSPAKKSNAAGNVWAFLGTDDLQVKEAAQKLSRSLVDPANADFGLEIVEGGADNAEHAARIIRSAIEALQTAPFFGGDKVVWLKGATFLADTPAGRAEATLKALDDLMAILQAGVPPDVKLVLTAYDVDKRRSFYLNLKKVAAVEVFDVIDSSKPGWEEQVMALVEQRASEKGLAFDDDALALFIALAGEQTRQIESELEKLDLYVGDARRVAAEDVRQIVAQTKTGIIWELGTAIGHRKLAAALAHVDQLLFQGESAMGILLAAIVPKVRNLFYARDLAERHGVRLKSYQGPYAYKDYERLLNKLPEEATAHLPKKKDGTGLNVWGLFQSAGEAENYTAQELRAALEECLASNRRLVTSQLDAKVVLNQFLLRVLSKPVRKAAGTAVKAR